MIKIYDLNDYELSYKNASYGGMAGDKDGIVIDGAEWMVKYPKNITEMQGKGIASYSTAPLSEFLGSHIYEILGFDVHKTILGEKNNKLVVACKDFATEKMLLEIRTIKNHMGDELAEKTGEKKFPSSETHVVDLDELLLHIRNNPVLNVIDDIEQHFFEQATVDIFIGNNDRNNGNWGILREKGKADVLAPVFDNGGSFLTKASEEKVIRLLNNSEFEKNTMNVITAYGKDGHFYSAIKFLEKTENEYYMQKALETVVPRIRKAFPKIQELFKEIPDVYVTKNNVKLDVCSENRKLLYIKQMQIRMKNILEPAYEKALDNLKDRSVTMNSPVKRCPKRKR